MLDKMYLLSVEMSVSSSFLHIVFMFVPFVVCVFCGQTKYPVEPSKMFLCPYVIKSESLLFSYPFVTVNYICTQKNGMVVKLDTILKIYGHIAKV